MHKQNRARQFDIKKRTKGVRFFLVLLKTLWGIQGAFHKPLLRPPVT
jgi:hypothetical protein